MRAEYGSLAIRIHTLAWYGLFGRSNIVGAHRRISRWRSVNCCLSGRGNNTFFLALDASGERKEDEQEFGEEERLKDGGTLPARFTGLAFLQSLSPAHLCQRDSVVAHGVTT